MCSAKDDTTRFTFGKNWRAFLDILDDNRIAEAERSLKEALRVDDLKGLRFLDVGSGSGLFSLAARRLGASVQSFDYDPESVACTMELKRRYFADDSDWSIERGSVLDREFMSTKRDFDVVYSWGVLHHTGAMWLAFENVAESVKRGGRLFISIYNDQKWKSHLWVRIKRLYNQVNGGWRYFIIIPAFIILWGPRIVLDTITGAPFRTWRGRAGVRGMHPWRDLIDWVGGYPFEVAKPEEVFAFFFSKKFTLIGLKTVGGSLGCNEYVFKRDYA